MQKINYPWLQKLSFVIVSLFFLLQTGCEKVDAALDYLLDFEGIFADSGGNEVTLSSTNEYDGKAVFTKVGPGNTSMSVGDEIAYSMSQISDNSWEGLVRERPSGSFNFFTSGEATIDGNVLIITPLNKPAYSYNRVAGGGGSGGGGGVTGPEVIVNQCIDGNNGDKKIIRFTLPSGVTKMEIKTSEVAGVCDRNTADLFVRKGSDPTVTKTPTYSWVADCSGIKPNRESEVCVFNNPGSGQWSIMLFGYNTYFFSQLTVTITR